MGLHREFSFEDDIELLDMKYKVNGLSFQDYFNQEQGANELINNLGTTEIEKKNIDL